MCIRTIINRLYCAMHLEYTPSIAMVNITSMILGPLCSKIVTIQRDWRFLGTNKQTVSHTVTIVSISSRFTNVLWFFLHLYVMKKAQAALMSMHVCLSAAINLIIWSSLCSPILSITHNQKSSISKLNSQDENLVSISTCRRSCRGCVEFGYRSKETHV